MNLLYRIRFFIYRMFIGFGYYETKGKAIFVDHFFLDSDDWIAGQHWGMIHPEQDYQYTSKECVNYRNGELHLTTKKAPKEITQWGDVHHPTYAKGELTTKQIFNKGTFEIRCETSGNWDAFWLWCEDYEIDVLEIFKDKKLQNNIHLGYKSDSKRYKIPKGFHTHTLIWDKELTFKFDGITIRKEKININANMWLVVGTGLEKGEQPHGKPFKIDWIKVYATD